MATIAQNLAALRQAKTDIASAITTKGGTVAQGDGLSDFAADIGTIPSGVDTSNDTVTPATLAEGVTAHDASGQQITGTMQGGLDVNIEFSAGSKTIPANFLKSKSNVTNVTMAEGITSIDEYAFYSCNRLTSITIPNSVTRIGNYVFAYCTGLTSVTIPDNVTGIGINTFGYCTGLTSVTIGNGVTYLNIYAFNACTGLTSVTIGNGVTYIDSMAFYDCSNLTTITIDKPQGSVSGAPWGAKNATVVWTG